MIETETVIGKEAVEKDTMSWMSEETKDEAGRDRGIEAETEIVRKLPVVEIQGTAVEAEVGQSHDNAAIEIVLFLSPNTITKKPTFHANDRLQRALKTIIPTRPAISVRY